VLPLHAFGRELVLFRGSDGIPAALDGHCRHLGAHLGHGGRVAGCELVCPFHHWRWNREGVCTEVPYASRIPRAARTRAYPLRDRNGFLYLWHHERELAPSWEVEAVPEALDPRYRITARKVWPRFRSHPQELSENGVDVAHFRTIHEFETRGIDWQPRAHTYSLRYDMAPLDAGAPGEAAYALESFTEGPSCTRTRFTGALNGITLHSCTPLDPGWIAVHSLYYFRDDVPEAAAQRVFENSQAGWAKDVEIWSHKRYRAAPLLTPEEALVPEFRRWFSQFY